MSLFLSGKLKTIAAFLLENTVDINRSILVTHWTSRRIKRRLCRLKGKQPMIPKSHSTLDNIFNSILYVRAQFDWVKNWHLRLKPNVVTDTWKWNKSIRAWSMLNWWILPGANNLLSTKMISHFRKFTIARSAGLHLSVHNYPRKRFRHVYGFSNRTLEAYLIRENFATVSLSIEHLSWSQECIFLKKARTRRSHACN